MDCLHCKFENPPSARFCQQCGQQLPAASHFDPATSTPIEQEANPLETSPGETMPSERKPVAIEESQRLTRRNWQTIPLAPILTFWVAKGDSDDQKEAILPQTMGMQLGILQEYCSVKTIVLWSGPQTVQEMINSGHQVVNFDNFLDVTGELPLCTSAGRSSLSSTN